MSLEIVATLPRLPPRRLDAHKGDFGRVLIVAGSRGMSGAAILCGLGALRGGAGLVEIAVPAEIQGIVAGFNPCYLTAGLTHDPEGRLSLEAGEPLAALAAAADVVAFGPGLGQSDAIARLAHGILAQVPRPLVFDADGLNALARSWKSLAPMQRQPFPLILTPHPGEFGRLTGLPPAALAADRESLAAAFARQHDLLLVLKGHETLVTDGRKMFRNPTGNPGMATGGSGDVLTGLIAALVAQRIDAFSAAQLGTYLHGRAGDLARDKLGEMALTALDLPDYLPLAIQEHAAGRQDV